jgi:hypothetical protein
MEGFPLVFDQDGTLVDSVPDFDAGSHSSDVSEIKIAFGILPERPTPNIAPSWI